MLYVLILLPHFCLETLESTETLEEVTLLICKFAVWHDLVIFWNKYMKRKEVDPSLEETDIRQWAACRHLVEGKIAFVLSLPKAKDLLWNNCRYLLCWIPIVMQRYLIDKLALKLMVSVSLLKETCCISTQIKLGFVFNS